MAKRRKTPDEKAASRQRAEDATLIKRYARFCYLQARHEKAEESGLPHGAIVPVKGQRHSDVQRKAERAIRNWFHSLAPHSKPRARAKMRSELGIEVVPAYTSQGAPGE